MQLTGETAKQIVPLAIQNELDRLDWSRYRLAKETGISHTTINNICNGVHEPKVSLLKTIADVLGVSIDKLLSEPRSSKNSQKVVDVA